MGCVVSAIAGSSVSFRPSLSRLQSVSEVVRPFLLPSATVEAVAGRLAWSLRSFRSRVSTFDSLYHSSFAPAAEGDWRSESSRGAWHPDPLRVTYTVGVTM